VDSRWIPLGIMGGVQSIVLEQWSTIVLSSRLLIVLTSI